MKLSWQLDRADRAEADRLAGMARGVVAEECVAENLSALSFDRSIEGERSRRHQIACGQALSRTLDTLLKVRRSSLPGKGEPSERETGRGTTGQIAAGEPYAFGLKVRRTSYRKPTGKDDRKTQILLPLGRGSDLTRQYPPRNDSGKPAIIDRGPHCESATKSSDRRAAQHEAILRASSELGRSPEVWARLAAIQLRKAIERNRAAWKSCPALRTCMICNRPNESLTTAPC